MAKESKLTQLVAGLSEAEQKVLEKSLKAGKREVQLHDHRFSSKVVRFGYFSDPHIGSKYFDWNLWSRMADYFKQQGIKVVYSPGDIVEGMSGRPGQLYELEAIGFNAQADLAAQALNALKPLQVYSILGNHDLWFKDKSGVDASIGRELEHQCSHFHCLGDWEADVQLGKGVVMKLFHANDGTA